MARRGQRQGDAYTMSDAEGQWGVLRSNCEENLVLGRVQGLILENFELIIFEILIFQIFELFEIFEIITPTFECLKLFKF